MKTMYLCDCCREIIDINKRLITDNTPEEEKHYCSDNCLTGKIESCYYCTDELPIADMHHVQNPDDVNTESVYCCNTCFKYGEYNDYM